MVILLTNSHKWQAQGLFSNVPRHLNIDQLVICIHTCIYIYIYMHIPLHPSISHNIFSKIYIIHWIRIIWLIDPQCILLIVNISMLPAYV